MRGHDTDFTSEHPQPTERAAVGAIVVGYGRSTIDPTTAEALRKVGRVVVVMNPRGSVAEVTGLAEPYDLIIHAENRGYAAAVNSGRQALGGTVSAVLVLTHDAVLSEIALGELLAVHGSTKGAGVIAPALIDVVGTPNPRVAIGGRYLGSGRSRQQYTTLDLVGRSTRIVDWADGACLLISLAAFDTVGGFDESTFMYVEEVGFCLAARDFGWSTVVASNAHASQRPGGTSRPGAHSYLITRNHLALARRRRGTPGAVRAGVAGVGLAGRETIRWATDRHRGRFHRLQAIGAMLGVFDGLRSVYGPPPKWIAQWGDVVVVETDSR